MLDPSTACSSLKGEETLSNTASVYHRTRRVYGLLANPSSTLPSMRKRRHYFDVTRLPARCHGR